MASVRPPLPVGGALGYEADRAPFQRTQAHDIPSIQLRRWVMIYALTSRRASSRGGAVTQARSDSTCREVCAFAPLVQVGAVHDYRVSVTTEERKREDRRSQHLSPPQTVPPLVV